MEQKNTSEKVNTGGKCMSRNINEAITYHTKKAESLRQEAIQWTKNGIPALCKECEEEAENHEQLVTWLTELKELKESARWISISEQLPEEYKPFEVTTKETDGEHTYILYFNPISKEFICAFPETVVAWRHISYNDKPWERDK